MQKKELKIIVIKKIIKILRAAIISLLVALLFVLIITFGIQKVTKEKFEMATYLLNIITIDEHEVQTITPVLDNGTLINYPTYGTNYASLKIESAEIELPIYYGADYTILKSGIAHDERSYFPGEGGSIILAGHNFKKFLANLPKAQVDDIIEFNTTYGNFKYKIYDTKIIGENEVNEVPIQDEKEILMIYTCYPINNIGHATQRYVVYANRVEE